jgi:hypothetical protein
MQNKHISWYFAFQAENFLVTLRLISVREYRFNKKTIFLSPFRGKGVIWGRQVTCGRLVDLPFAYSLTCMLVNYKTRKIKYKQDGI